MPTPILQYTEYPVGLYPQVTSYWLSETGLLALRGIQLLFFAVTLTLEGTTGGGSPCHVLSARMQARQHGGITGWPLQPLCRRWLRQPASHVVDLLHQLDVRAVCHLERAGHLRDGRACAGALVLQSAQSFICLHPLACKNASCAFLAMHAGQGEWRSA